MDDFTLKTLKDYINELYNQTYEIIEIYQKEKKYIFLHNTIALVHQYANKFKEYTCADFESKTIKIEVEKPSDSYIYYLPNEDDKTIFYRYNFNKELMQFLEMSLYQAIKYFKNETQSMNMANSIKNCGSSFIDKLDKLPVRKIHELAKDRIDIMILFD